MRHYTPYGHTLGEMMVLYAASQRRRKGASWAKLADYLASMGYRNRKGKPHSASSLCALLNNLQPDGARPFRCLKCGADRPEAKKRGVCPPCIEYGTCSLCPNTFVQNWTGAPRSICDACRLARKRAGTHRYRAGKWEREWRGREAARNLSRQNKVQRQSTEADLYATVLELRNREQAWPMVATSLTALGYKHFDGEPIALSKLVPWFRAYRKKLGLI